MLLKPDQQPANRHAQVGLKPSGTSFLSSFTKRDMEKNPINSPINNSAKQSIRKSMERLNLGN